MNIFRKYILPLMLALLVSANIQAQDTDSTSILKKRKPRKDLELLYNFGHIGHNVSFNFTRYLGKKARHAITGGLKYHLETKIHNNSSAFDGWTFYQPNPRYGQKNAASSGTSWKRLFTPLIYRTGFTFGYRYSFPSTKASSLSPFVFYQLQITISLPAAQFPDGQPPVLTEKFTAYENAFGAGIQPKLHKKLSGLVSAGFGSTRFLSVHGGFWERSINVRFGVTYTIGKAIE